MYLCPFTFVLRNDDILRSKARCTVSAFFLPSLPLPSDVQKPKLPVTLPSSLPPVHHPHYYVTNLALLDPQPAAIPAIEQERVTECAGSATSSRQIHVLRR